MKLTQEQINDMAWALELLENSLIDGKREDVSMNGYSEITSRFAFLLDWNQRKKLLKAIETSNIVLHGSDKTSDKVRKLLQ